MKIKIIQLVILISVVYLIVRSFFNFPVFSDEIIYINMAKAFSEGLIPYKDFFFAHPPFQLIIFQPILLLFGASFFAIKFFVTLLSVGVAFLTYLIAKEIFDEKTGFYAFILFLIFPGFIIFSNQAFGIFEALFFFLLSFYYSLKKKPIISGIFLTISIFTRYLTILLIPFMLYYIYKYDRKNLKNLVKYSFISILVVGLIFLIILGENFIIDTVYYHLQVNVSTNIAVWINQYLTLGFFTTFLSITAIMFSRIKKDQKILLFALYPIIYDAIIILILNAVIYHYFIIVLPFVFIAAANVLSKSNDYMIKGVLVIIMLFAIVSNINSITFFLDEKNHEIFPESLNNINENEIIFGEPRITNYISFVTDAKIANNYYDSGSKFFLFTGSEKIYDNVNKENLTSVFINHRQMGILNFDGVYDVVDTWEVPTYYSISMYKPA